MEPKGCPETLVRNYQYSLCNNPEEHISHLGCDVTYCKHDLTALKLIKLHHVQNNILPHIYPIFPNIKREFLPASHTHTHSHTHKHTRAHTHSRTHTLAHTHTHTQTHTTHTHTHTKFTMFCEWGKCLCIYNLFNTHNCTAATIITHIILYA